MKNFILKFTNLNQPIFAINILLLFILWFIFSPFALFLEGGMADDFAFLYTDKNNDFLDIIKHFIADGRFVKGLYLGLIFKYTATIHNLGFVRLLSLLGWSFNILFFVPKVYQHLHQLGDTEQNARWKTFLIFFFWICSIPMITYLPWVALLEACFAFFFATLAGFLIFPICHQAPKFSFTINLKNYSFFLKKKIFLALFFLAVFSLGTVRKSV